MEMMLFLLGSNRSPLYHDDRVYCERAPSMCMASLASLVTTSLGPTLATGPGGHCQYSLAVVRERAAVPYFWHTSYKSRCVLPPSVDRSSHQMENPALGGPGMCFNRQYR